MKKRKGRFCKDQTTPSSLNYKYPKVETGQEETNLDSLHNLVSSELSPQSF